MTTIFMYHRIAEVPPANDPAGLVVSPRRFEQQMAALARGGYRCVALRDAIDGLARGENPCKTFALTFDDGFRDFYTTAWPVMQQHGFTATVFPVAGFMGRDSDWAGQSGAASAALMTWDELREVAAHGVTVGSHTMTHPRLATLPLDQARAELAQSKQELEAQLGTAVDLLSYPYSNRSPGVQRLAAELGYYAACASDRGPWDRFNVWRMQCWRGTGPLAFRLKAWGVEERITWLREATAFGAALKRIAHRLRGTPQARVSSRV